MQFELVLSIVGCFLVVVGSINAFFLRGIFQDINTVKIKMAQIFERSDAKERRINELEEKERVILREMARTKERLHSLEGGQVQMLEWIKSEGAR